MGGRKAALLFEGICLTWPGDWQTSALFLLRWAHLISGVAWLGMLLAFLLMVEATLPRVNEGARRQVEAHLLSRLLFWMRWSALATVFAGIADYVLLLSAEGIAPRIFVFLAAWLFGWAVVASLLWLSASGKALADGRWLGAVVVLFLAVLGWSGEIYMRRGGSHKTISLSLGGGLALLMFANTWFFLTPDRAESRLGLLAARLNACLTPVVLFLMGSASHFPLFR